MNEAAALQPRVLVMSMWPSERHPEFGCFVHAQFAAFVRDGWSPEVAPLTEPRSGRLRTPLKYLAVRRAARRAIRATTRNVVLAHYLVPMGVIARNVARRAELPYVVTAHGTDVRNAEDSPAIRARTEPVVRDAALVIAVSQDLADRLVQLFPGLRVEVVDMGIDTSVFTPRTERPAAIATSLSAPRGDSAITRIVAVGHLLPNKNHDRLLEAVALVPEAHLEIIGEGPERAALEQRAARDDLAGRVSLVGHQPRPEVARRLQGADVATLVSEREGYGLAALEAAACGARVVVARSAPVAADLAAAAQIVDPFDVDSIAGGLRAAIAAGPLDVADARDLVVGRTSDDRARTVEQLLRDVLGEPDLTCR